MKQMKQMKQMTVALLLLFSMNSEATLSNATTCGYNNIAGSLYAINFEPYNAGDLTGRIELWMVYNNKGRMVPGKFWYAYDPTQGMTNKVTLLKGKHGVVSGQHFIQFDNGDTSWGDYHPLCYPIEKNFTQVHHFKWDYSVLQRLKEVSSSKLHEAFSHEYKKMLSAIEYLDYKLDLNEREFMFERVESPDYKQYRKWKPLTKKILKIGGLI